MTQRAAGNEAKTQATMQYCVRHTTTYSYTEPVPVCHNLAKLAPRATPNQVCHDFRLAIEPEPTFRIRRQDYFGNQVIKVDTETGARVGAVAVAAPDNLSWSPTGELLAASHHGGISSTLGCNDLESGSCGFRFQIVAIDPEALTSRVLLDREGAPMGAATVALPSLSLSALQLAVASAVAAGARTLEAAAVVTEASTVDVAGYAAVRDLSATAPVYASTPDGTPFGTLVGPA